MGDITGIAWTDHTANLWFGCSKVSPGCDLCYAEGQSARYGHDVWGADKPRHYMLDTYWKKFDKWNREAEQAGRPALAFLMSMGDILETPPPHEWVEMTRRRERFFTNVVPTTPWVTWQILTKRPHNFERYVPPGWLSYSWPRNVWAGTSTENQRMLDIRIRRMNALVNRCIVPPPVVFFSVEPMIGPVDFRRYQEAIDLWLERGVQVWVIFGGESDIGAPVKGRPLDIEWIEDGIAQCEDMGLIPFVKQLGSVTAKAMRLRNKKGEDPLEWPIGLRVQDFPLICHPGQQQFIARDVVYSS